MKERILAGALALFMRRGIRSTAMADLAQELGISKKTIYKWFENKDQLVAELLQISFCQRCEPDWSVRENAVLEFCLYLNALIQKFLPVHPAFFHDLRKYHPAAHQLWEEFKQQNIIQRFKENLSRGIQTGLYRPELDPEIMARLYVGQLESIFNPDLFPLEQFNRREVYQFNLQQFVAGIVSAAGLVYAQQFAAANASLVPQECN